MKYKKLLASTIICALGFIAGFNASLAFTAITASEPVTITQVEEVVRTERVEVPTEKVVTVEVIKPVPRLVETELEDYEKELIARVVMCEAPYEDMIGKRLVVDTILNRVDDPNFPNNVYGVVYQDRQFCKASMYSEECMKAVEMELYERLDYDVLWFRAEKFHNYGVPAYQHGNHYFSWGGEKNGK